MPATIGRARSRISAASNEELPRRIRDDGYKKQTPPVILRAYAALPPVIVCATSHPSSCANRSVVDGAMQTPDLSHGCKTTAKLIPDQRRILKYAASHTR